MFVLFNSLFNAGNVLASEIVISEFSFNTTSDWVEIYNNSETSVDLSPFRLRDSTANNKKDLSGTINPKSFVSFAFGMSLNKAGDTLSLYKKEAEGEKLVDSIVYGNSETQCQIVEDAQSIGRLFHDGSNNWVNFKLSTKDLPNNSEYSSCKIQTPQPTIIISTPVPKIESFATILPTIETFEYKDTTKDVLASEVELTQKPKQTLFSETNTPIGTPVSDNSDSNVESIDYANYLIYLGIFICAAPLIHIAYKMYNNSHEYLNEN